MSLKNSRQMYSIINDLLKRLNLVRDPEKALSIISHTAYKYIGFRKNNPFLPKKSFFPPPSLFLMRLHTQTICLSALRILMLVLLRRGQW